ncbi:MAG: aminotransferase class V-fold PLP-dependent enzyme [Candidatus Marinamargulisbacteria bacterium]
MNVKHTFPIFQKHPQLVYLDSGATTQKPALVIDAMSEFLKNDYGTVHRGIYELSAVATQQYDSARKKVQHYINAASEKNVIFTKGTTDGINLIAQGFLSPMIKDGDEILITEVEHHANFVPWQMVAKAANARVVYAPVSDAGELDVDQFCSLINDRTRMIAMTHISNVLGSVFPIKPIIEVAKKKGIPILIDGAQAIAHEPLDIQALDPDVYCFSGHKMYGPTGIGVCYISDRIIDQVQPVTFGGDMIESVSKEATTFTTAPLKFEAGTPPILEVIGLAVAIDYINDLGRTAIQAHETAVTQAALEALRELDFIELIGNPAHRSSAISFNVTGIHPHDLGTILDTDHVAIRVGHHCAQPAMRRFNVPATARASFGVYNELSDVSALVTSLKKAREVFGY